MLDSSGDNSRVLVSNYIVAREEVRIVAIDIVVISPNKIIA